jgi:hypothetical protein
MPAILCWQRSGCQRGPATRERALPQPFIAAFFFAAHRALILSAAALRCAGLKVLPRFLGADAGAAAASGAGELTAPAMAALGGRPRRFVVP